MALFSRNLSVFLRRTGRLSAPALSTSVRHQVENNAVTYILRCPLPDDTPATKALAEAAKEASEEWGKSLIEISKIYKCLGFEAAKEKTIHVLTNQYAYGCGQDGRVQVLFKPTLTVAPFTFRPTLEGALSYFVGRNPNFPGDKGFALKGWKTYSTENFAIHVDHEKNFVVTMGKVILTNDKDEVTEVDKSWGFQMIDGKLRIVLHHSSLPYNPKIITTTTTTTTVQKTVTD